MLPSLTKAGLMVALDAGVAVGLWLEWRVFKRERAAGRGWPTDPFAHLASITKGVDLPLFVTAVVLTIDAFFGMVMLR